MTVSIIAQQRNEFYKKASSKNGGAFIMPISYWPTIKEIVNLFCRMFCLLYGKAEQRPEYKAGTYRKARLQADYTMYSQSVYGFG